MSTLAGLRILKEKRLDGQGVNAMSIVQQAYRENMRPMPRKEDDVTEKTIHQVKEVMEIRGDTFYNLGGEMKGVNNLLSEGWILLHVYSDSIDSDNGPAQVPVYVLGRIGEWKENDDED